MRIGISGWNYPSWRGAFYPPKLPHRAELSYAAARLGSIEVNASFYRLQKPETFQRWAAETPDDFVFAVKGSRYITHMMRLESTAALANFFASGVLALGPKLAALLWQLPATMPFDEDVMRTFVAGLPETSVAAAELATQHDERLRGRQWLAVPTCHRLRHAIEVRHESFRTERFYALLRERHIGLVIADSAGKFPVLDAVTADFVYVRLHGAEELYASGYDETSLRLWRERIARWTADERDVFVYFDNDARGHAPFDALRLQQLTESVSPG